MSAFACFVVPALGAAAFAGPQRRKSFNKWAASVIAAARRL